MQNQPAVHDNRRSGQVLPFRRTAKPPAKPFAIVGTPAAPEHGADNAFARYEEHRDAPINDRQRMLMNLIAVAIVVLLISVGVGIADAIRISGKKEDCALQGRTNCEPIDISARR
jgi:hypothetical protein